MSTPEKPIISDTEEKPIHDLSNVLGHERLSGGGGNPGSMATGKTGWLDGLSGRVATFIPKVDGMIPENGTVVVHICVEKTEMLPERIICRQEQNRHLFETIS